MVGGHETGNETYVRGLTDGLSQMERDFDLFVYHAADAWMGDTARVHFRRIGNATPWVRLTVGLARHAMRDSLDVLHVTYTAPIWAPCPVVVTVHDISYTSHPEWFSRRDLRVLSATVPLAIRQSDRVITVSELCRQQIIDHYRVPETKVVAIPNAAGRSATALSPEEARQQIEALGLDPQRPYVLAVGNLQPRKNLLRLFAAMRNVWAAGVEIDLVVAGPKHYRAEEVLAAGRASTGRITFTGYLTDRQLAALYANASVFAFPSLFEGFGIPALEAMSHGVPVVCSNAGALPEVCGDAALYFDPLDSDSIAAALRRAITDSELRSNLVRMGRTRESQFSWARSAEMTLSVYGQAARHSGVRQTIGD
jgi:glycosyltransferase involved in cell wall biosynthesis